MVDVVLRGVFRQERTHRVFHCNDGLFTALERGNGLVSGRLGFQAQQHLAHEVVHHAGELGVLHASGNLVARVVLHLGAFGLQGLVHGLHKHGVKHFVGRHDGAQGLGCLIAQALVQLAIRGVEGRCN